MTPDLLLTDLGIAMLLAGVAAFLAVMALAMPAEADPRLQARLRVVARERGRLRDRRLSELAAQPKGKVRLEQRGQLARMLRRMHPEQRARGGEIQMRLRMAGFRGPLPEAVFFFFRAATPIAFALAAVTALFLTRGGQVPLVTALAAAFGAGAIGFVLPRLLLDKLVARRQTSIAGAFPDALDLLLICVQSGLSVEAAMAKVARDIACQSIELAEELSLTMAELSYLPLRWKAYANLAERTGLPAVKLIAAALMQAERYGTSVGQALTAAACEGREARLAEAERKAASLPPKLAVPLVAFFLPVLLAVILAPGLIQANKTLESRRSTLSAPAQPPEAHRPAVRPSRLAPPKPR